NGQLGVNVAPTAAEINGMHAWGANFVRVMLSADFVDQALLGQSCPGEAYDPQYASYISDIVSWAATDHMFVLFDMQSTNPNCYWNNMTTSLATFQSGWSGGVSMPMPGTDVTDALSALAQKYRSNPLVGFELYNEPHVCQTLTGPEGSYKNSQCSTSEQSNAAVWANGGTVSGYPGPTYTAPGMNALYSTVRHYAPSSLVFVDANNFASDPSSFAALEPTTNAVYVLHYYPCWNGCTNSTAQCPAIAQSIGNEMTNPAVAGHTVVYDEFGWQLNQASTSGAPIENGEELANVVSYLASLDLGWSAFAWGGSGKTPTTGSWELVQSISGSAYVPDANGVPIRQAMLGQPTGSSCT
ncbi:MAG: glycoside hydrolase family 5 protein, partial [Acidimicrobiales bacterium]